MERTDRQPAIARHRGMKEIDLPGPRLLPAVILPLMRSIGLPLMILALALDACLFAVSRMLGWPCWSSLCILAN